MIKKQYRPCDTVPLLAEWNKSISKAVTRVIQTNSNFSNNPFSLKNPKV